MATLRYGLVELLPLRQQAGRPADAVRLDSATFRCSTSGSATSSVRILAVRTEIRLDSVVSETLLICGLEICANCAQRGLAFDRNWRVRRVPNISITNGIPIASEIAQQAVSKGRRGLCIGSSLTDTVNQLLNSQLRQFA